MSIRVALNHKTTYQYDRPVTLTPHLVRLRPAPHCRTPIVAYSLKVSPEVHFLNWQQDAYSNYLGRLVFPKPATLLSIEVDLIAEMTVINPFDFFLEESAETYPFQYDPVASKELIPYLETEPASPRLLAFVETLRRCCVRTQDYLVEINQRLCQSIRYLIRLEPGIQTCEETLTLGSGSCRDSAWLLVQTLRHLGLAARFVSGYLIQLKPDVEALDGPSGTAVDFTLGARSTSQARAGSVSTRRRVCSSAKGTSRSPARPILLVPHRSRARIRGPKTPPKATPTSAIPLSGSRCR